MSILLELLEIAAGLGFAVYGASELLSASIGRGKGKEWFAHIMANPVRGAFKKNGKNSYYYRDEFGYYTIRKDDKFWHVTCSLHPKLDPYFEYTYHTTREENISNDYKKSNLVGWGGSIALSPFKVRKAIMNLQETINQKIIEVEKNKGMVIENEAIEKKKNNYFRIEEWDEEEIVVKWNDKKYCFKWKDGKETIKCNTTGYFSSYIYEMTRDIETGEIVQFDINNYKLTQIENPKDFAKEEESVWNDILAAIENEKKKKETIKNIWENKEIPEVNDWELFEKTATRMVQTLFIDKEMLEAEDVYFLEETFPKRMEQLKEFRQSEEEMLEEGMLKAQHKILKRLENIQEQLHLRREKEKEKIFKLIKLETEEETLT